MRGQKKWWVKERQNPQLGTYYVPYGQLSKRDAAARERSLYGYNVMWPFATEAEYRKRIAELKKSGENVHEEVASGTRTK